MARLTRIGVLSLAKFYCAFLFVFGFVYGVIVTAFLPETYNGYNMGLLLLVAAPVLLAIFGLVFGIVFAFIFNLVSSFVGGIEIGMEKSLGEKG